MKKAVLICVAFLLAASSAWAGDGSIHKPAGELIEGQYIVVFNPGSDSRALATQLAAVHGAKALRAYSHAFRGAVFAMNENAAHALSLNPNVALVEQDSVFFPVNTTQSNPPSWGLDRIDQRNLPLSNSYTYDFTGAGVRAYILDTGIRTTHVDFGGRASWGTDCTGEGQFDGNGHGTHVAGTTGSATYGVAKGVNLIAVKVCTSGGSCPNSAVLCGVDFVVQQKQANPSFPMVANMSLRGPASPAQNTAVNNAVNGGVFFAVAAGNDNQDACNFSPASAVYAYTIGATDTSDGRSSFSNFGPCVDIFAPGSSITSTWNTSDTATNTIDGTSMASPHAAGAAALVFQEHPMWTPSQVTSELNTRATTGVLTGIGTGSPNRLLFTLSSGSPQAYHPAPYSPATLNPLCGAIQAYACDMDRNASSPGFGKAYLVGTNASTNLPSPNFQVLIAAFDAPGNLSWSGTYYGAGQARAVAVDSQGALVVATTTGVLRFPIGSPWSSYALSGVTPQKIAFDASDNVYVTGYTGSSDQVHTVRLDKTAGGGLTLSPGWPRTFGNPTGDNEGRAIVVKNAVYVAGTGYRVSTGQDALVLKYPLTGGTPAEFWYDGFAGGDALNDLVVDASGNVFATGSSANDFETIPTDVDDLTLRLNSGSFSTAAWITRYDAGRVRAGGQIYPSIDTASFLALDPTGQSLFVTGSTAIFHSDILTLKYSAATGTQLAKSQFDDGATTDSPSGLFVSSAGQVFVGGVSGTRYVLLARTSDLSAALYGTPSYVGYSTVPTVACMVGRNTSGAPALFSGGISRVSTLPCGDPQSATGIQWVYP